MMLQSINPTTEEILGEVKIADRKEVNDKVKAARKAFSSWSLMSIDERVNLLQQFVDEVRRNKKDLSILMTKEMGKIVKESEEEIDWACNEMEWHLKEGKKYLERENVLETPQAKGRVQYEPLGVVGIITPWNFPLETPIWSIAPALLAGNTVVWKPSELVPSFSLEVYKIFQLVLPKDVFNIAIGADDTGKHVVDSSVDMISFTGSSSTGKKIASRASKKKLKKVSMELGGSDPAIVLKDADIDKAVDGLIIGRFYACGQCCTASKRIYVEQEISKEFIEKFLDNVRNLKVGDPLEPETNIGPMVSREQLELLERQVNESAKMGAHVLCGGSRYGNKGYFYQPTVMANVNHKMPVMKEETFGPIAPIMPVKNIKEAIKLANDTPYGLGASVWTNNKEKVESIAKQLQCGIVWINDANVAYPQCPWGGVKDSGTGRVLSKHGILEFVNIKSVIIKT